MRRCVTCRQTYADQTLKFCRNDGTPLINDSAAPRFPDLARFDPVEATTLPYPAGRTTGEATSRSLRDATHSTSQKLRNAGPSIAVMPLTNISADPENEGIRMWHIERQDISVGYADSETTRRLMALFDSL